MAIIVLSPSTGLFLLSWNGFLFFVTMKRNRVIIIGASLYIAMLIAGAFFFTLREQVVPITVPETVEKVNWVRDFNFNQVSDEPVVEPHLCIDSTHAACDGGCECDGMECED
jgi:hypothetical protein